MKAKEYFRRLGQSARDRLVPSFRCPGIVWTSEQKRWYLDGYYAPKHLKPKELAKKAAKL